MRKRRRGGKKKKMRKRSEGEKLKAGRAWLVWSGSLGGQCQEVERKTEKKKFTESGSDTVDRKIFDGPVVDQHKEGGGREERKAGGAQQQHGGEALTSALGFTKTITN